ncbi:MAG: hypothetical protein RIT45_1558 [Pseudomonadota bacterium]
MTRGAGHESGGRDRHPSLRTRPPWLALHWTRDEHWLESAEISGIPPTAGRVRLRVGDVVELAFGPELGEPATIGADGAVSHARFGLLREGEVRDDGRLLRIHRTSGESVRVRADKGVNFPDGGLRAEALVPRDREALPVVVESADAVGLSFVRDAADVAAAREALQAEGARQRRPLPALVVKLETAEALRNLPAILFETLRHPAAGVMIARGDLSVEVGYERLSELQQEIMWFAEAASLPVIWATQVLDALAHDGVSSRAAITDASVAVQAECVMLNKGPHVVRAAEMRRVA